MAPRRKSGSSSATLSRRHLALTPDGAAHMGTLALGLSWLLPPRDVVIAPSHPSDWGGTYPPPARTWQVPRCCGAAWALHRTFENECKCTSLQG